MVARICRPRRGSHAAFSAFKRYIFQGFVRAPASGGSLFSPTARRLGQAPQGGLAPPWGSSCGVELISDYFFVLTFCFWP